MDYNFLLGGGGGIIGHFKSEIYESRLKRYENIFICNMFSLFTADNLASILRSRNLETIISNFFEHLSFSHLFIFKLRLGHD